MSKDHTNSDDFAHQFDILLTAARRRCEQSVGDLLTVFRDYLLLAAQRDFVRFKGQAPVQLMGRLKAILAVKIARTNCHDRHRLQHDNSCESSLVSISRDEPRAAINSFRVITLRAETHEAMGHALANLPSAYRRVIVLRNLENRSFVDIARELGWPCEATRKLWFRAIVSLQRCYGGMQDEG